MLARLLRVHLRPYRWLIVCGFGLQLVQTVATLLLPTLNAAIVDDGVLTGDTGYITRVGALMVLVALVQITTAVASVWFGARAAMGLGRDVRTAVFRRLQGLSVRQVGEFGTPSLLTRTVNDAHQVQHLAFMAFTVVGTAPATCVGAILLALRQDVPLTLILVALMPVIVLISAAVMSRMSVLYRLLQASVDGLNRILREQITGVRVVRAFVREAHEAQRFNRANAEWYRLSRGAGRLTALMYPAMLLVLNGFSVLLLWFGGVRVDAGDTPVGALNAFLGYLELILVSVIMALFVVLELPRARASAERIQEVLDTSPDMPPPTGPAPVRPRRGVLRLSEVTLRRPGADRPIVADVDLSVGPGETLVLVGATGSGKTTVLNLAVRLADPTGGQVCLDDEDVRHWDPAELRRRIGLVPQRSWLFTGTVADNLRYGDPEASDARLWEALETAQAADFVAGLPGGLAAPVTQGGGNFSGGQRQRLAIARTLVRRPDVYLFDDCFSALDASTGARVRSALAEATAGAAVVMVLQRLTAIRPGDRVAVLDEGRVVGAGRPDELLRSCPAYREIAESQRTGTPA